MWRYRFEAKSIQDFILATDKLKEIAGASRIVDDFSISLHKQAVTGGKLVSSAAGFIELDFDSLDKLQAVAGTLPFALSRLAPGLSFAHGWVEHDETNGEPVNRDLLNQALSASRNRPLVSLPEAAPVVMRTSHTGLPAVKGRGDKNELIDRGSQARQKKAKASRDTFEDILEEGLGQPITIPSDLSRLAEKGYLALLHADGNGVGKLIQGGGISNFQEFSSSLSEATRSAFVDAAKEIFHASNEVFAIRPVILGGDDMTIILQAKDALNFSKAYLKAFEKHTGTLKGMKDPTGHLTACIGIALIKSKSPFYQAHELAEQLCKASKKALRPTESNQTTPSGVLFHRVTTSLFDDWETISDRELWGGKLSYGPYTLTGPRSIENLDALASLIAGLSRGAFREWLRLLKVDSEAAKKHWMRTREVQSQRRGYDWKRFDDCLKRMGVNPETCCNEHGKTPIADAITLRALVDAVEKKQENA